MTIIAFETLYGLRDQWNHAGIRVVFTNGVFDLLHSGHVTYLQMARKLGDVLVVGLNSDGSTRSLKGPRRPLVPQSDRAELLAALRCVDYVTIFEQPTAEELVAALRPAIYVKGGDYAQGDAIDLNRLPEARVVLAYGGIVKLIPYREGRSTSALIARIVELYSGENGERRT